MNTSPNNILLVDDDPATRRVLGSAIASAGFEVLYAKNGNEGREMARRIHPRLILMDIRMPIMNGIEAIQRLKTEAETKDIPIILLTNADLSLEAEKMAKESGVADYIQKGTDLPRVIESIKKALEAPTKQKSA